MSPLKSLLLLFLALLSASALAACGGKASERRVAVLNGQGFSVSMPGNPTRKVGTVQTQVGPQQLTVYVSQFGSQAFAIGGGRLPAGAGFNLDGAVQGEVTKVQGILQSVVTTSYQGFPARDARITADSNGTPITIFERTILAHGAYFNLQFLQQGADVKAPPASYTTFLASLKIT